MGLPPIPFIGIFCSPLSMFSCVYVLIEFLWTPDKWTNTPVINLTQVKELMASQPGADGRTLPLFYLSFIPCGHYPTSICFHFHHYSKSPSCQGYGFSSGHVWMWELNCKESWAPKNWCFWTVVLEKTLESPLDCKGFQPVHPKGDPGWSLKGLGGRWKDWCWSWNSNTLATWWERLTHLKRPWCWERLRAGGEGDDRGWGGWMASETQWTWVWVNSGSWWWTGRPGMLWFIVSQRVGHDWATELNWARVCTSSLPYVLNNDCLVKILLVCFDVCTYLSRTPLRSPHVGSKIH